MRWLVPSDLTSLLWRTTRSIIAAASLSSPRTVPHFPNPMLVLMTRLLLSRQSDTTWKSSLAPGDVDRDVAELVQDHEAGVGGVPWRAVEPAVRAGVLQSHHQVRRRADPRVNGNVEAANQDNAMRRARRC
jgi:hypothetical protein